MLFIFAFGSEEPNRIFGSREDEAEEGLHIFDDLLVAINQIEALDGVFI